MTKAVYLVAGKRITLGERLGRGGEGEVFRLDGDEGLVVKLYAKPDAGRAAKIPALCAAGLSTRCPDVALPIAAVCTCEGIFAGFVMRHAGKCQPIHELITPSSRRQHFPAASWRFLVRAALNVARVVAQVHGAGIVIGDINSSGFLVSPQATITLIDADSMQFGGFRCRVGMPEYTPPELQGRRFDAVDRTVDHDAFGLAIMLFQILALGRHPYAGVVRGRGVTIEDAIAQGRFAYSEYCEKTVQPPAGALRLADLPRAVRVLFERAFAVRFGPRPTALEWVSALKALEASLVPCGYRSSHVYPLTGVPCPWCRIERSIRRAVFDAAPLKPDADPSELAALAADVAGTIRRALTDAGPAISPRWPGTFAMPSDRAMTLRRKEQDETHFSATVPRLHFVSSERREIIEAHDKASKHADAAICRWRDSLGTDMTAQLCALLSERLNDLRTFSCNRSMLIEAARQRCLRYHARFVLRNMLLNDATVQGLGAALKRQLASHGVLSAADLTREALDRVPGLGRRRTAALLLWHDCVTLKVEESIAVNDPTALASLHREATRLDEHAAVLTSAVARAQRKLETHVEEVVRRAASIDMEVARLIRERNQMQCDLAYIGV